MLRVESVIFNLVTITQRNMKRYEEKYYMKRNKSQLLIVKSLHIKIETKKKILTVKDNPFFGCEGAAVMTTCCGVEVGGVWGGGVTDSSGCDTVVVECATVVPLVISVTVVPLFVVVICCCSCCWRFMRACCVAADILEAETTDFRKNYKA